MYTASEVCHQFESTVHIDSDVRFHFSACYIQVHNLLALLAAQMYCSDVE